MTSPHGCSSMAARPLCTLQAACTAALAERLLPALGCHRLLGVGQRQGLALPAAHQAAACHWAAEARGCLVGPNARCGCQSLAGAYCAYCSLAICSCCWCCCAAISPGARLHALPLICIVPWGITSLHDDASVFDGSPLCAMTASKTCATPCRIDKAKSLLMLPLSCLAQI